MKTVKVQTKKKFKITLNEHQAKCLAIALDQWLDSKSVPVQSDSIQDIFISLSKAIHSQDEPQ